MKKQKLPTTIEKKCHAIIHSSAVTAGSIGALGAQIPVADNLLITPIQIGMVIALAKVFDRDITREAAYGVIKGVSASIVGRNVAQLLAGWIPVVGNVINSVTASSITEGIGWLSADQFYSEWLEEGHTENDLPTYLSQSNYKESEESKREYLNQLRMQALAFIDGKKDAKGKDKEEFDELYTKMSCEIAYLEEEDPFVITFKDLIQFYKS